MQNAPKGCPFEVQGSRGYSACMGGALLSVGILSHHAQCPKSDEYRVALIEARAVREALDKIDAAHRTLNFQRSYYADFIRYSEGAAGKKELFMLCAMVAALDMKLEETAKLAATVSILLDDAKDAETHASLKKMGACID